MALARVSHRSGSSPRSMEPHSGTPSSLTAVYNACMRRDAEFFGDRELVPIYMARRLKKALALEAILTAGEINYAVVTGRFTSGFLFRSERIGALFYVDRDTAERARALMKQHGLEPSDVR
jgi:hypothetical protein